MVDIRWSYYAFYATSRRMIWEKEFVIISVFFKPLIIVSPGIITIILNKQYYAEQNEFVFKTRRRSGGKHFVQFSNKWIILKWVFFFPKKPHTVGARSYVCNSLSFKVRITCSCWIRPTKLLYRRTTGLTALWQTCCEFGTAKINSLGKYRKKYYIFVLYCIYY